MQETSPGDSFLPEHQGPKSANTTNPQGYTPTPDEQKTLRLVDSLYQKAKKHKSKYDHSWLDYYKFFRGKQWKEQRPSYRHSEVINLVFQSIQSTVPIQTDTRPKIQYVPRNPIDTDFTQILNKVCESDWEKGNWLQVLTEIIYEANFYGAGIGSMTVDPGGEDGPEIVFAAADPFYQYPDPSAIDCNKKSKYWVEAEPVDIEVLKKDYPDKAQFIKPDVVDLSSGDKTNIDKVRFKSPVDNRTILDSTSGYDITDRNQCLKITCYIAPGEYESNDAEQKDAISESSPGLVAMTAPVEGGGVPAQEGEKKPCPNGRKIIISAGLVLYDGENPYDDKKFPYARLLNYSLPREFWGISEVEQLQGPNKIHNKILSFALDVMTLMGNPIWVVDTSSGVDADNLFNRPGLVVEKEPHSEVRREEGVQLQPYVMQMLERVSGMFDNLSGAKDITKPAGTGEDTPSGDAIDAIQEAAQTRLRLKARHLDAFLQNMGQMYAERVMQFYSAPKVVRTTGEDGGYKYFKFHIETMLDEAGNEVLGSDGGPRKIAKVRNYRQNQDTGKVSEDLETTDFELHGKFDVKVSTGSSLPFAKNQAANKAMRLYTMAPPPGGGVIDAEELLKQLDYPNYEIVVQRLKERQDQMAQQQQMQAAQGPPPKG